MTNSRANVRSADSGSMKSDHRFPWKWNLADLKDVPQNGKTVFSCFSCGGGSSMGYKLAGYDVIGIFMNNWEEEDEGRQHRVQRLPLRDGRAGLPERKRAEAGGTV